MTCHKEVDGDCQTHAWMVEAWVSDASAAGCAALMLQEAKMTKQAVTKLTETRILICWIVCEGIWDAVMKLYSFFSREIYIRFKTV